MKHKKAFFIPIALLLIALLAFAGCGGNTQTNTKQTTAGTSPVTYEGNETYADEAVSAADATYTSFTAYTGGALDGASIFTTRDLRQDYDAAGATALTVEDGKTIEINEAGVYVLTGSAENCTVKIAAAEDAKVELVLDNVTITNESFPAVYLVSADKLFITTAEGSENTLAVTGSFTSDGTTNTDAVIFAKDDVVFSGLGTLTVKSAEGNGISGKDDLKFTGGSYAITAEDDGIEANDSIAICGGSFTITAEDGLHAENDDDDSQGWIYIANADIKIDAASDAIHATTVVQIDSGEITVSGYEGIEGTVIQINGGTVNVTGQDDGINAGAKSKAYGVLIEINGGEISVSVGNGDTDAIDSNGDITVNGGTVSVTTPGSAFDYDGKATYNGGTIIINGVEVNAIPQSMMPGMMGGRR